MCLYIYFFCKADIDNVIISQLPNIGGVGMTQSLVAGINYRSYAARLKLIAKQTQSQTNFSGYCTTYNTYNYKLYYRSPSMRLATKPPSFLGCVCVCVWGGGGGGGACPTPFLLP